MTADLTAVPMRAEAIPTTVLADTLRDHGSPDRVLSGSIAGLNREIRRCAGWAATVTGGPAEPGESGPDHAKARAIDAMTPGTIAVWAGGDVEDVCLFGDLLGLGMRVRGVRGAVVDGGVRDLEDMDRMGFAVHGRYRTPVASTGFWRVRAAQTPVELPGRRGTPVTITPGDLVVADVDGVVSVPRDLVEPVLATAEERLRQEAEVRGRIEAGESLDELLRRYGRI